MDRREESENTDLHSLAPFLDRNQLAKGYVATKWWQKAEPGGVSLTLGAKHEIWELQREFVETQTYAWAK